MDKIIFKSIAFGFLAAASLLGFYFSVLTLVSGGDFAWNQFSAFWYFIVSLALGFGVQIGLYVYLKNAIHGQDGSRKVIAVSGMTSTVAMVSCCAHYLANLLPIIATAGILTIISQYQIQLFWIGLASNLAGIVYILNRLIKFFRIK